MILNDKPLILCAELRANLTRCMHALQHRRNTKVVASPDVRSGAVFILNQWLEIIVSRARVWNIINNNCILFFGNPHENISLQLKLGLSLGS